MTSFFGDVLFSQRLLSAAGLYHGLLDSDRGPLTKDAEKAFLVLYSSYQSQFGEFDSRTENNIITLLPKAQVAARKFMTIAKRDFPFTVRILSGTRTYAEQNALYAKRPRVTRARGGQSNHNFGIAFDVGIFDGKDYFEGNNARETKAYRDLAKLIKPQLGFTAAKVAENKLLDWGGDWKSIVDMPHYELHTGKSVAQCRALLEKGKSYV